MTKYQAGVPMKRVHLDFLGPLPESTAGNTNILVIWWTNSQNGLNVLIEVNHK